MVEAARLAAMTRPTEQANDDFVLFGNIGHVELNKICQMSNTGQVIVVRSGQCQVKYARCVNRYATRLQRTCDSITHT